ncbi:MAG TPA: hypothetical protein VFU06_04415, partial [Longimicrobiales bacterium]|nr:hypothetical protein [Longimicrobiales bacterium]
VGSAPAAPRPKWFRESETFETATPPRADGAAASGTGVSARYMEPWRRGTAVTLETSFSQTRNGASGVLTERQRWEVSTDICPSAEGIVKGRGTLELASDVQIQEGGASRMAHASATNHFTVTVRVNDDAIPVDIDIQHSVEGRERGPGGDEKHWITEAAQTSVDPGISVDATGNTTRDHTSSDGTLHTENLLSTEGTSKMVAAAVVLASSYVKNSVEEAFDEWWGGSCLEVRSRRQPERSRLRAGESADFELEVLHYQDDDVVALPVDIEEPDQPDQGTVTPTVSSEGPARFTFTAPSGSAWQAWRQTRIRSHSTSRRGRANVHAEGPTFSRRNEREFISVTVRDRTSTERLGDVYDIVFTFTLTPDETDPEMLRSAGTFSGTVVGNDANCLDGHDTPSNPQPVQGPVQEEAVGYVAELDGRRSLHFSVTGDLPPLDGLERNVSFILLEGIPLPAPGSAPVTYRRVVPFGFTGVIPECTGAVESISEVTVSSSLADG